MINNNPVNNRNIRKLLIVAVMALTACLSLTSANADSLYISDGGSVDDVKRFNATTGAFEGVFVNAGQGLHGPRGIIFTKGRLFLVNQNVNQPFSGEVLRYNPTTGAFISALVPCNPPLRVCNANAPFFPRGMIRGPGYSVYVADWKNTATSGRIAQYNLNSGAFIRNLSTTGFVGGFFPRAIVRGPDDLLYVSVTGDPDTTDSTTGYILRFSAQTGKFVDVFTSNTAAGCAALLNHPEGLTFGPDGRLYVTNLPNLDIVPVAETGRILVYNRVTRACVEQINLGVVGGSRGFAASLIFGPNNLLYIPDVETGAVRRYNTATKTFSSFIPAGTLDQPWYMSFGLSDPESLEYLN